MKKTFIFILLSLSIFACKQDNKSVEMTKPTETVHNEKASSKEQHTKAHWSYSGEKGPAKWSHLSGAYKDCAGHTQSPIDIQTKKLGKNSFEEEDALRLKLAYNISKANINNNGHTIQFNIDDGSYLGMGRKRYNLKQFHFHSQSEHTIDGKRAPLEVHFVNEATDGTYAVIAVLFEEGKASSFFDKFLNYLPKEPASIKKKMGFTLKELLPSNQAYYHYKGSFTTPPCTEIVDWFVMKNKITASSFQLLELKDLLKDNYRPIQKTNDRKVTFNK